jgi:hypothetical protein
VLAKGDITSLIACGLGNIFMGIYHTNF